MRAFWIVLDSAGIGNAPDAEAFGDEGSNTWKTCYDSGKLHIPNMEKLGIYNIDEMNYGDKSLSPIGCYGRLHEKSMGKDTTIGHWEMAGMISPKPFPVYPDGFPKDVLDEFRKQTGREVLCNKPYSGTEVIKDYGREHMETGALIVYTSADSVFQIAAHEDVVPVESLYEMCETARHILTGKNAVARVIARPFVGENGNYKRTPNRRDFSLKPSEDNILCRVRDKGLDVIGVGKIHDIFAGVGLTESKHTNDNQDGMDVTLDYMKQDNKGIIYTNLVEFDSTWGHRRDYKGYARGLEEFDDRLAQVLDTMKDTDMLVITADHGCDPTYKGTDHTREYVPLLVYGKCLKHGVNLGTGDTYADIAQTLAEIFGTEPVKIGKSFLNKIM